VSRLKTLWVREPYLGEILAGAKTVEVRAGYENIRRLAPGDRLRLNDRHLADVRRVTSYAGFEELLAHENAAAIAPSLSPGELLAALRDLYPPEKEALGAVALELSLRRFDAVLFDLGYTLVYFDPPQEVIVQAALRAAGAERSTAEILAAVERVWSKHYRDAWTARFAATEEYDRQAERELSRKLLHALSVEGGDEVLSHYRRALEEGFGRPDVLRPYPEATEVLDELRSEGYRLGIVSNWSWNLRHRVQGAGLDGYFELVWGSAYAGCSKPHPAIFEQALAQMDLEAARVLFVGDSYHHDVRGARGAGMAAALVDRSNGAAPRDCPVIPDLRGVLPLLSQSD
jgi:HAD superfamily hydrolase (TIGR01662 family)